MIEGEILTEGATEDDSVRVMLGDEVGEADREAVGDVLELGGRGEVGGEDACARGSGGAVIESVWDT